MKMKLKAVGDSTPEEDKVYLQVLLPRECETTSKPMFFSKVGKVLNHWNDKKDLWKYQNPIYFIN